MIAAVGDLGYRIVQLIHLFSVIVGMGAAFAAPVLAVNARRDSGLSVEAAIREQAGGIIFPMLLIAGTAGGALVGMSADFYDFGQTWLAIGGALWMVTLLCAAAAYPPGWMRLFSLTEARQRMMSGILHLSLVVLLILMVWKFGAPAGV